MKRLIPSIIIFTGIIATFIFGNMYIRKECNRTKEKLLVCENAFKNADYPTAYNTAKKLQKDWEKSKKSLALFVNHTPLDEISENFSQLPNLANNEANSLGLSKISEIYYLLSHIKEHQNITVESLY